MIPDFDIGHSPWHFPVHIHWHMCKWEPTRQNVWWVAYKAWVELGDWNSWLRITTGRPLPIPWGHMAHVFLGEDLSWRDEGGRDLAGVGGGDLRYQPPVQDWAVPCWIDDKHVSTLDGLGMMVAHEVEHLLGRLPSHPPFPTEQLRANAQAAVRRSRGLVVMLPDKASTPPR